HRLISGLEERGFVRRLPHRARALEVVRLPDALGIAMPSPPPAPLASEPARGGFAPNVIRGSFGTALPGSQVAPGAETVQLPLYGRIAAGTPIEALRDNTNSIDVPASLLGRGDHYCLEVDGDSMIGAGILD